jgi:hypothetical protein
MTVPAPKMTPERRREIASKTELRTFFPCADKLDSFN